MTFRIASDRIWPPMSIDEQVEETTRNLVGSGARQEDLDRYYILRLRRGDRSAPPEPEPEENQSALCVMCRHCNWFGMPANLWKCNANLIPGSIDPQTGMPKRTIRYCEHKNTDRTCRDYEEINIGRLRRWARINGGTSMVLSIVFGILFAVIIISIIASHLVPTQ